MIHSSDVSINRYLSPSPAALSQALEVSSILTVFIMLDLVLSIISLAVGSPTLEWDLWGFEDLWPFNVKKGKKKAH